MKNISRKNKILKGVIFFAVFAALSANAYGQTSDIKGDKYTNDSNHTIIHDGITAAGLSAALHEPSASDQTGTVALEGKNDEPGLGKKITEITQTISQFLVMDDDRQAEGHAASLAQAGSRINGKDGLGLGLALTSSYINNHLLEGRMQLEFHANPMSGGGGIFLKKNF